MNRRTLLSRIVQGFSITGLAFVAYPFFRAFLPGFSEDLSIEIDISDLSDGESKTISWLGRNLYVIKRRDEEIRKLAEENERLKDPQSTSSTQPAFARNRWRSRRPDVFIVFKNCTHLGCEVSAQSDRPEGGFECPCHTSRFDSSGRVYKEAAALFNLEVPDYRFISRHVIRLVKG